MFIFVRAASLVLAVLLTCAAVRAQPTSDLIPPVAQSSTDVPYPAGAEGEAEVVLDLVVEKDGSVSRAAVVEGVEPFAESARAAALAWRFVPARRGDVPIVARIRARVAFREPREALAVPPRAPNASAAAPEPVEPAPAPAPVSPAPAAPVEISVIGERREIGQTTLSKTEVRELPGAFGDAFRAIEILPGVTPLVSGVPFFYMRGAPPNNAGYWVDGVRIPFLFHVGVAQSVIHPGLIDRVDFFPSVAPARYGGFVGGTIAGQTRAPANALRGEANLRLVDAGALLEAPFAGDRGSALVAGRYGYPGPILAAVTDEMKLDYWDYQARVSWNLGPRDTIGLFAFGGHDTLATRSDSDREAKPELVEQYVSDFHRLDLRYDHAMTDGRVRFALTGGYDSVGAEPTYMKNKSLGGRLEVEQGITEQVRLRGGIDARVDDHTMRVTARAPRLPVVPVSADPPPTNLSAGAHLDFVWRVTPRVELVPGARLGLFASSRRRESPSTGRAETLLPAVDPRLTARVVLAPGVAWLSGFGLSHQFPSLRLGEIPAPFVSVPGFPFGTRKLQSAAQASQGFEVALPAELVLSATGFYSSFWGLTDLSATCFQSLEGEGPPRTPDQPPPPLVCPNNDPVRGRAYGVELMLRRPLSRRVSGWLSYTLSRTTQDAHFLTPAGTEEIATVASQFDRTHVLNAALSVQLGRGWGLGSRLVFYTGTPYSRLDGSLPVRPYNAFRTPAFTRVDVRMEKRWHLSATGSIAFVVEGQNVTLSKETSTLGLDCEGRGMPEGEANRCAQSKIGPLTIPSIGVEAFF